MAKILEWFKDGLGINKYAVAWRYEYPGVPGEYHDGVSSSFSATMPRSVAENVAASMSRVYGPGTHWVVKESAH